MGFDDKSKKLQQQFLESAAKLAQSVLNTLSYQLV